MGSTFSDLKPNPKLGVDLWNEHKEQFKKLLEEINSDVFSNDYYLTEKIPDDIRLMTFRLDDIAQIRTPCITLERFGRGFICISPRNEKIVQITFASCSRGRLKWMCERPSFTKSIIEILRDAVIMLR